MAKKTILSTVITGVALYAATGVAVAASLSLSPQSGTYGVGQNFSVRVMVASADQALNAVSGQLSFDPATVRVISLSKSGSIISLWATEPSFSNTGGTVSFEGVALDPGYTGSTGKVLTIQFRALSEGSAPVRFLSGEVLANDGKATSIIRGTSGASYSISPAVEAPVPEPIVTPPPAEQSFVLEVPPPAPAVCVSASETGFLRIGSMTFTLLETILLSLIILILTFFLGRYSVLLSHGHLRRQLMK